MKEKNRATFSGTVGFVLAAAGSAVGLGNIWRFPYLAAKDGGGLFLVIYLILAVTFGFALLTTEITLGRKTAKGPLGAYGEAHPKFKFMGLIASIVPAIILPYYCAIGGWIIKYMFVFLGLGGERAAEDGYFTEFISGTTQPIVFMFVFMAITAIVIALGVNKGIENTSKVMMPILLILIVIISVFSLTLKSTADDGTVRTGLEGLKIYVIPNLEGMGIKDILSTITDAMGQLFFSISVAMGIMVAYGSYCPKDEDLMGSVNKIEFFDTLIAFLAGLMIIPAVFTFAGREGMSAGPGLMFITLPKVFAQMGMTGQIIGMIFFVTVFFAAITSSVSIFEAIVSGIIDEFKTSRKKAVLITFIYALIVAVVVCLGYNHLYFELPLPNGSIAQVLDLLDYISNSILMPVLAIATCILFGWVVGPKYIIDEIESTSKAFKRKKMYIVMMKYIAPVMLLILLIQSL